MRRRPRAVDFALDPARFEELAASFDPTADVRSSDAARQRDGTEDERQEPARQDLAGDDAGVETEPVVVRKPAKRTNPRRTVRAEKAKKGAVQKVGDRRRAPRSVDEVIARGEAGLALLAEIRAELEHLFDGRVREVVRTRKGVR